MKQSRKPKNNSDQDYVSMLLKDSNDAEVSWLNNDYL